MNRSTIGDNRIKVGDNVVIPEINGRKILIMYTWHNYSPSDYRKDIQEYKEYIEGVYKLHPDALKGLTNSAVDIPSQKLFLETIRQEIEYDLSKHPITTKDEIVINFQKFREISEQKVSQIISNLLQEDPSLIPAKVEKPQNAEDIMAIEIDVEGVRERDWYFTHFFKKTKSLMHLDKERMSYKVSGYWLLHNIVIPTCHLPDDSVHHEDARIHWLQQLKEHQDVVELSLIDDKKLRAELKGYVGKNDSENVLYLYWTVHGVWSAVLSEFYAYYNARHYITIPAGAIQNYHRILEALAAQSESRVKLFYEQYVGYQNIGTTGEYSMGKIMGAIACVVTSENYRKPYDIFLDGNKMKTNSYDDRRNLIRSAIISNKDIRLANFDQTVVRDVLNYVRSDKNLNKFIEYVEQCFNELKISQDSQIFNNNMFKNLIQKANARKTNKPYTPRFALKEGDKYI